MTLLREIEDSIARMTFMVRGLNAHEIILDDEVESLGWWVLACGEPLDEDDFESRERARDAVLKAVEAVGVVLPERIWVWDDTGRAQLVITTLPSEDRAERVAEHLRSKGLQIRIRPQEA